MLACWALGPAPRAHAQAPDSAAPAPVGATSAPQQVSRGEVAIRVEAFGVGDTIREGDWAGIRLALTDSADKPRDLAVQLHLPDGDGDTPLFTRIVTLSPGQEVGVWLYAPMPWAIRQGSALRVSVSRVESRESGVVIGEQVAWAPIAARRVTTAANSLAAVIGQNALGLEQYAITHRERDDNPGANEITETITALTPEVLPDAWQGWGAYSTILWSDGEPDRLQGEGPARALREWVSRGGHLVIVLPAIGETWTAASSPLADLMPSARVDRLVDVDMAAYRVLLAGSLEAARVLPAKSVLHRFVIAPDTEARDATPVITGPHGTVVVRRLVGTGMVTVIGLDLNNRAITRAGFIRADAFWSRILGLRAATMTVGEMDTFATASKSGWARTPGASVWIDDRIGAIISKGREASVGILMGLIVFIVYLIIAGPGGYFILKRRGLERHAWVAFVLTTILFTIAAWAGASALRPRVEQAWHYTILNHIYGQPVQRARAFISILLPDYGNQTVSLGAPDADQAWNQALTPWTDPASDNRLSFPDARSYLADVRRMTDLTVPARSTIKTFRAEWTGGPRWSMPVPTSEENRPRIDASGRIIGELIHSLPGAIREMQVILVRGQVSQRDGAIRRDSFVPRQLIADAFAWTLTTPWEPGVPLPLANFQPYDTKARLSALLQDVIPRIRGLDATGILPSTLSERAIDDMVAFYGALEQPDPGRFTTMMEQAPAVPRRRSLHTMDISEWMTQPCLVILGIVDGAPTPVPFSVGGAPLDGKARPCSGRTAIRWIYPLPPRPHRVEDAAATPPGSAVPSPAPSTPEPAPAPAPDPAVDDQTVPATKPPRSNS